MYIVMGATCYILNTSRLYVWTTRHRDLWPQVALHGFTSMNLTPLRNEAGIPDRPISLVFFLGTPHGTTTLTIFRRFLNPISKVLGFLVGFIIPQTINRCCRHVSVCLYVGVSENGGFSPQLIHFDKDFHYKSSVLRYHYFWKHPYVDPFWYPSDEKKKGFLGSPDSISVPSLDFFLVKNLSGRMSREGS